MEPRTSVNINQDPKIVFEQVKSHISEFPKDKLPTKLQVLQLLFYETQKLKCDLNSSLLSTTKKIKELWDQAKLQTQDLTKCKKNYLIYINTIVESLNGLQNKNKLNLE